MFKEGTHLLFVYETAQVPYVAARVRQETVVIALDYEVELELQRYDISFISVRSLAVSPEGTREPVEVARRLSMAWYESSELAFFRYRGVVLGEPHKGPLHYYFGFLLYFLVLIDQAISRPGVVGVSVFESFKYVSNTTDPTARYKERLPADITRLLAARKGIACEVIQAPAFSDPKDRWGAIARNALEIAFRLVTGILNAVSMLQKPRRIRLLVTDPWKRVEPFVSTMSEVELILTRRADILQVGKNILKTRVRFHHRLDFVDAPVRALARMHAQEFGRAWDSLGATSAVSKLFVYQGISFWEIVKPLLNVLIKEHAEDAIATIESTKRLIEHYGINCVLLFSSLKGYNNLIAQLAEQIDIPSIEMQHALELTEPSHPYSALHSRYLAAYGPLTQKNYERFGVAPWRVVSCGSPRFDGYVHPVPPEQVDKLRARLHLVGPFLNVLVLLHSVYSPLEPGEFTSYSANDLLLDLAALQRGNKDLRFMLRPHAGDMGEKFYARKEVFAIFPGETRSVHTEDLRTLLALTDIVVAGYTTVVLEAMMAHKPVLMYLPKTFERDFQAFEDAGAVLVARTLEELRAHTVFLSTPQNRAIQVARADRFLARSYLADGNAAARVAGLIRSAVKV